MNANRLYLSLHTAAIEQARAQEELQKNIEKFVVRRLKNIQEVAQAVGRKSYGHGSYWALTAEEMGTQAWTLQTIHHIELEEDYIKLYLYPRPYVKDAPWDTARIPRSIIHMSTWAYAKEFRKLIHERKNRIKAEAAAKREQARIHEEEQQVIRLKNLKATQASNEQKIKALERAIARRTEK